MIWLLLFANNLQAISDSMLWLSNLQNDEPEVLSFTGEAFISGQNVFISVWGIFGFIVFIIFSDS